jgi:hypothetical protein
MKLSLLRRSFAVLGTLGLGGVGALQACSGTSAETCSDLATCVADGGNPGADGSQTLTDGTAPTSDGNGFVDSPISTGDDGSASTDDAGVDTGVDATPPCDVTQAPSQNGCVIADGLALFVSVTTGNDSNAGTMGAPLKTLAKGISLAQTSTNHRVFACAGTYPEALSLSGAGAAIFGGFACPAGGGDAGAAWTYPGTKAVIAPSLATLGTALAALKVTGVSGAMSFADLEVDAPTLAGTTPPAGSAGTSSVAAFVSGSSNVSFTNVKLVAENATGGAPGAMASSNWYGGSLDGKPGSGEVGGGELTCACGDGTSSQGGAGGSAADGGVPGPGAPPLASGTAGEDGLACNGAGSGGNGNDATASSHVGAGAASYGTLSGTGWSPLSGASGGSGSPGQGGGGGGDGLAAPTPKGAGGGGACGGCGGAGASAGGGGGSSFALLVFQSTVTLKTSTLVAKNAGGGGAGGPGQQGQGGSQNGGVQAAPGCQGGGGGSGSGGNGGGGGAGGISAGIAFGGTTTITADGNAVTPTSPPGGVTFGTGGGPGGGGAAGAAAASGVSPKAGSAGSAATTAVRAASVVQF